MRKKLLLFAAFLLLPAALFATDSAHYFDVAFSPSGKPIAGASIRVCTEPATTTPCTPLTTIYSDYALTTPLANPFLSSSTGNYEFYAVSSEVAIEVSFSGYTTVIRHVALRSLSTPVTPGAVAGGLYPSVDAAYDLGTLVPLRRWLNFYAVTGNFTTVNTAGDLAVVGDATVSSLNKVCKADGKGGANAGEKIAACVAALPATGGTVDARGLEGAQTISSTLAVAKPVTILFGAATFTASAFPAISVTVPGVRLIGLGAGQSVIKVADGAGIYQRLVYASFTGSGLEIAGLTFDHNVANNPRSAKPDNVNDPQMTIGVYGDAKHIRIHDNEVKNTSSVNNFDVHALNIEDVWLTSNRFTNIGNDAGLKGTHTGANNAAVLTDAAASWTVNGLVGLTISNLTDISSVVITANTANTVTGVLAGGTDNDWDTGDLYSIQFDSSVIYTHGIKVLIEGNVFEATTPMDPGAVTAIETHGSDTTVRGNAVRNFVGGANITGVFQADTRNVIVADNIFDNCMSGIRLWSQTYAGHVAGFGLDGVNVRGNKIALGGKAVFVNAALEIGIGIVPTAPAVVELDSRGISITDNIITHPLEGVAVTSYGSYALGWSSTDNMTLYDSEISRNTVVNFPKAAIRLECVLFNVKVENNILRNVGSSLEAGVQEYTRAPISIMAYAVSGLTIDHNSIVDDIANTRFWYPIWLYAESGTPTGVYIRDNTFLVTGAKNAAFRWVKPYQIGGPIDIKPLFVGQVPDIAYITTLNTELFTLGSRVLDTSTGSVYQVGINGYTWAKVEDGPTGNLLVNRVKATRGTALAAGDFALSGGWGSTASVGTLRGTDQFFSFVVTSAGTGQGASPTITFTYHDGTWTTAPPVTCNRQDFTSQPTVTFSTNDTSATALVLTFNGTPVAAETYKIACHVGGI